MLTRLRPYGVVSFLAIAALLLISSTIYSMKVSHDMVDIHTPLVDAAMRIKFELAMSHLLFEEFISGDTTIALQDITAHIGKAKGVARMMISGGNSKEGSYSPPLDSESLRKKTALALKHITRLSDLIQIRLSDIKNAQPGSKIDQEFDRQFTIAQDFLESVESTLHETIAKERANQKVLNYVGLNFSLFLFATIFITLVIQRRRELLLMARLEKLAAYDELTGLLNRRQFDSILSHEWSHAMRTKTPISIVICDIDFFKQYNDRLGHQAGDACLRSVALVMQSILRRPVDSVSRYGGEEFAFVFPLTDEKGAKKMIDTLHSSLKNRKIPHPGSPVSHNVTLTAGLASVVPGPDHTISRFIMEADQALYRGKKEGRNRTCCAEWTTDSATADKKILTN